MLDALRIIVYSFKFTQNKCVNQFQSRSCVVHSSNQFKMRACSHRNIYICRVRPCTISLLNSWDEMKGWSVGLKVVSVAGDECDGSNGFRWYYVCRFNDYQGKIHWRDKVSALHKFTSLLCCHSAVCLLWVHYECVFRVKFFYLSFSLQTVYHRKMLMPWSSVCRQQDVRATEIDEADMNLSWSFPNMNWYESWI